MEEIDAQERGKVFDYFIGLLFNQLPNVQVYVGKQVAIGEVDVFVTCIDSPNWLRQLVGDVTMVENKWTAKPTQTKEISGFHQKANWSKATCKICYFVSMNGFTSSGTMSAEQMMHSLDGPKMVGLDCDDVDEMVTKATPEDLLRSYVM